MGLRAVFQSGIARVTSGTIDGTVIGGTTPAAGTFTVLKGQTQDVTGKTIINNNAATPVTIAANTSYLGFTGTNLATLTVNYPNAAAAIDGLEITVYFSAAVGTALTLASTGATFVDAPATVAAKTRLSFIYDNASTQWIPN